MCTPGEPGLPKLWNLRTWGAKHGVSPLQDLLESKDLGAEDGLQALVRPPGDLCQTPMGLVQVLDT